jgi:hypothetical protein
MTAIRFDDIDALNAAITDEFGEWGEPLTVTQDMINQFAELTGDRQWIHVDVERAIKESPFGGPVAHGFLTLSLLPRVMTNRDLTVTGFKSAANYGGSKLRFLAPVPAGSQIYGRTRLAAAEAKPKGTLVTLEVEIRVVGADRPAVLYSLQSLYM